MHLRLADGLSKTQDSGDWRLRRAFARQQIFEQGGFCWPDCDMLASFRAHQVDVYVAEHSDGRCAAVNAWAQHWGQWLPRTQPQRRQARKPVIFLFPQVSKLSATFSKIVQDSADCILVCPQRLPAALAAALRTLPCVAHTMLRGKPSDMVQATERVPADVRAGGWVVQLQAVRVQWPSAAHGRGGARSCGGSSGGAAVATGALQGRISWRTIRNKGCLGDRV